MRIDVTAIPAGLLDADPALRKLIAELTKLTGQHAAAFKARDAATRELDAAPQSDSAAYAAALRQGRDDPGPAAVRQAEEKVQTAQRTIDAAEIAAGQVTDEISDRVRDIAAKLRKHVDDDTDKARAAIGDALDQLGAALADHDRTRHVGRWITAVANRQASTPAPAPDVRLVVTDLLGERRPFAWHEIEAALRDITDPSRIVKRETAEASSMRPGVPMMLSEYELVHGRGAIPDEQPVG